MKASGDMMLPATVRSLRSMSGGSGTRTELLYRYAPEGKISEEKLLSTLNLMSEHLKRLEEYTKTMRQIRSFEEIELQKRKITPEILHLRIDEIAEALNAVRDIRILCGDRKKLYGDKQDTADEILLLDESLFLEVVGNLLSNALRYAKSRVEIFLEYKKEIEMLFLYIHDDGPGFDEKERTSAADPYFRGKINAEDDYDHFGIGLHICRVIAERHGGVLNMANGMDGGAFVSVSFFCGKS